ncbi:hypothetical protein BDE36_1028 [Arcticibacter tournemirensis]|uniref:Polysaccharide biosynthesis protein n=1 Tax=Arcticibacter tournemirensis TaxID=699437 RepID=A0A5M9HN15_9SPHI|nr:hypothetical protein [Arcticibacter tournemirensis]KAA8486784.1 hypothetical protein F1649_00805 [Arcticibacter tournemirensis]TQM49327.1 hypothetical protein BDE36_1028 [Arcticibacter tournemirensis]
MIKKAALALDYPYERLIKLSGLVGAFLLGQGTLQLIQVISGFLLFRWLSIEEYAEYSMAFAFQCTAHVLVEFGFSGTIVALVGNRVYDKKVIGDYIKAGQFYRHRLFLAISVFCAIIFPLLTLKHHFSVFTTIMLLVSIITNLYFTGWSSYYTPPLKMHKKVSTLYQIQVKSGALRLVVLYIMYLVSALNSWIAALLGSMQTLMNGYLIKKSASDYVQVPKTVNPQARREMMSLLKPVMPGIVFNAFQSQIMVFILSVFGATNNIAEMGALSKIGQLYMVLSMAGGILIAPHIARVPASGLLRKYLFIAGTTIFLCSVIVFAAYIFPEPLLWLLGSKYDHLRNELVALLICAGIGVVNGIIWEMNEARKWIYAWDPLLVIFGTISIQVACVFLLDLSSLHNVIVMSVISNLFVLAVKFSASFQGFRPALKRNSFK